MTTTPPPQRGDVESVDYADPPPARDRAKYRTPKPDERVSIRLHGHPFTYTVRVIVAKGSEPKLAELTITADDGQAVGYEALRSVPTRRLAHSARQWIARAGGAFDLPGAYPGDTVQPENADPRLTDLDWRIEQAVMAGLPVRATIANDLNVGKRTVDRMIAKARAEGLLEGVEIPRRPSPRQRDELVARHLAEEWLGDHGPDATPPPELLAEIDRLRRTTSEETR